MQKRLRYPNAIHHIISRVRLCRNSAKKKPAQIHFSSQRPHTITKNEVQNKYKYSRMRFYLWYNILLHKILWYLFYFYRVKRVEEELFVVQNDAKRFQSNFEVWLWSFSLLLFCMYILVTWYNSWESKYFLPFWCIFYVRQDIKTAVRDLVLHGIVSQSNRPSIINGKLR